jgi:hypothetical protein
MSKASVYEELIRVFSKLIRSEKPGQLGRTLGLSEALLKKVGGLQAADAVNYAAQINKKGGLEKVIRSLPAEKAERLLADIRNTVKIPDRKAEILARPPRKNKAARIAHLLQQQGVSPLAQIGKEREEELLELPMDIADLRSLEKEGFKRQRLEDVDLPQGEFDPTKSAMDKMLAENRLALVSNRNIRKGLDLENMTLTTKEGTRPINVNELTADELDLLNEVESAKARSVGMDPETSFARRGKRSKFRASVEGDVNRDVLSDSKNAEGLVDEFEQSFGRPADEIDEFLRVADKKLAGGSLTADELRMYNDPGLKVGDVRQHVGNVLFDFLNQAHRMGKPGAAAAEELAVKYPNMYASLMARWNKQVGKNKEQLQNLFEQGLLHNRPGYENEVIPMLDDATVRELSYSADDVERAAESFGAGGAGYKNLVARREAALREAERKARGARHMREDLEALGKEQFVPKYGPPDMSGLPEETYPGFDEFLEIATPEQLQEVARKSSAFVKVTPKNLVKAAGQAFGLPPVETGGPEQIRRLLRRPQPDFLDRSLTSDPSFGEFEHPLEVFLSHRLGGMGASMYEKDKFGRFKILPKAIKRAADKLKLLRESGSAFNPQSKVIHETLDDLELNRFADFESLPPSSVALHDPDLFSVVTRAAPEGPSPRTKDVSTYLNKLTQEAYPNPEDLVFSMAPQETTQELLEEVFQKYSNPSKFDMDKLLRDPDVRASLEGWSLFGAPPKGRQLTATAGKPVPNLPMLYDKLWASLMAREKDYPVEASIPIDRFVDLFNL